MSDPRSIPRGRPLTTALTAIVLAAGLGMGVAACTFPIPTPPPTATPTPSPIPTDTPTQPPVPTDTPVPSPTPPPQVGTVTIDYSYDPLGRLLAANYATGEFFHYTYDSVGNRLSQVTHVGTNTYTYDLADHLIEVDGVPYAWSANANLLSDGVSTYTYDHARAASPEHSGGGNRLTSVSGEADTFSYAYNGLGDRVRQTVDGLTTDSIHLISPPCSGQA